MARLTGAQIDGGGALDGDTTGITGLPNVTVVAGSGTETAAAYGISEALLAAFPELNNVFNLFKEGKTGEALEALYQTNYYKNYSPLIKSRFKLKAEQRPVWDNELSKYIENQRRRLVTAGIRIDDATLKATLTTAFENGFDDNQVDAAIMGTGKVAKVGGDILGNVSNLQSYARAFGVSNLYNQQYWDQIGRDLFNKTTTEEDIQASIRSLSASAFPAFAAGINNGQSMEALGSYITQTLSSTLERPVTLDSPEAKKFLQYINPKTGLPEMPPQWFVEKESKKLPGWEYTDNATATLDALSLRSLRDWGLA
jgi:hypothetical protein